MDARVEAVEIPRLQDDLTRIKGIGPRYAGVLAAGGILSYDDLAATKPAQLRDIIKPSVMQQINFDSWISQAAAYAQTRGVQVGDDLTQLEGIGPTYAAKLRERGITTFADLAATDEATLAGIIDAPAWRRINYADWIAQAQLAATGDELALQNLQDRLFTRTGDNLSLIDGLGGRSAAALQAAGITTFAALAAATPEQLDIAVREAGVRGNFNYEAWISEASLRAAGRRIPAKRARTTHVVSCPQDLSAVPGIGTIFEERLYAAGIGSYWELAETSRDQLSAILGPESLHGVDLEAIKAAAVQLAAQSHSIGRTWDGTPPDDLEVLPGIGEVYERRLYEAGICTYEALAAISVEQLTEICKAPPMRTPDYAAWIDLATDLSAAKRSG
jgi:predicted flap endonuclease-1-like 5' DNA nuclease